MSGVPGDSERGHDVLGHELMAAPFLKSAEKVPGMAKFSSHSRRLLFSGSLRKRFVPARNAALRNHPETLDVPQWIGNLSQLLTQFHIYSNNIT